MNLILNIDSYKASHKGFYPESTTAQFAYIAPRVKDVDILVFGLQMAIKRYLLTPITKADIDEADSVLWKHGFEFDRTDWDYILEQHNGFLPLVIKGFPEGTIVKSGQPIVTIESTDPRLFWLPSYVETFLQRAIWYPTTIATMSMESRKFLKSAYEATSDRLSVLDFALHDFGARGVTSEESAAIGGLAHLVSFFGTDNLPAIIAAREYYHADMAGWSIAATEHSVQCAYGSEGQSAYIDSVLNYPSPMVSVVLDGYDIYRDTELLLTKDFKGKRIVIRPDSGRPEEVIPRLLKLISKYRERKVNSKSHWYFEDVSIIQGDGIDFDKMVDLAYLVSELGYAADVVTYGSGGGLLQRVTRDTYGFAQKTSAMEIDGKWVDTVKSPITDTNKRSLAGRIEPEGFVTFYRNGELLVDEHFDIICNRGRG